MIRSRLFVVIVCAVVAAWSEQSPAEPPGAPVRTQRVLVPADARDRWDTEGQRYLPIDAQRFERWLRARQGVEAAPSRRGFVKAAVYRARLDEQQRMVGTTHWEIDGDGPWPILLHLAPQDAQFHRAVWLATHGDVERAAEIGMSAERRHALLVDKPGLVDAHWTLAPRQTEYERYYRLRLTECLSNRVELTLAEDLELSVDRGLAERSGKAEQGLQTWTIQPDARSDLEVKVSHRDSEDSTEARFAVRQTLDYRLAANGLTLEASFERNSPAWPPVLTFDLSADLRPMEVAWSGGPLTWERHADSAGGQTLVVRLPSAALRTPGAIRIASRSERAPEAAAPLPTVQLRGALWEEGTARIVAAKPLQVAHLALSKARQSAFESDGAIRVQLFEPTATIRVTAATDSLPVSLLRGVALVAEGAKLSGTLLVEFPQSVGIRTFVADVSPEWTIEAVEAEPLAAALEGWRQQDKQLALRLAQPSNDSRPLRLRIRGSRPLGDAPLLANDLRILELRQSAPRRDLVSLRVVEPLTAKMRFEQDLQRLAPEDLDLEASRLLAEPPRGLCFVFDESAERFEVSVRPGFPEFTADLNTAVERVNDRWSETLRVRVVPTERPIEELLLRSNAAAAALTWQLGDGLAGSTVTAKTLSTAELASHGLPEGELVVQLSLPAPRAAPFELHARVERAAGEAVSLALPALIGAAAQTGGVVIRAPLPWQPGAMPALVRVPAAGLEGAAVSSWEAAYRYDPTLPRAALRLELPLDAESGVAPRVWAWREELQTRVAANGERLHSATHFLENHGAPSLRIEWPQGLTIVSATLDGETRLTEGREVDQHLELALPAGTRFLELCVEFEENGAALGWIAGVSAPRVQPNYPVVSSTWQLGIPDRFHAWSPTSGAAASFAERLLGPLARSETQAVPGLISASAFNLGAWPWGNDARQRDSHWFDALAAASVGLANIERPTWGQWLAAWQAGLVRQDVDLLIDPAAAVRLGISPLAAAPRWSSRPTAAELRRLLADQGWVLLGKPGTLRLTDQAGLSVAGAEDSVGGAVQWISALTWRTGELAVASPWRAPARSIYGDALPDAPVLTVSGDRVLLIRQEVRLAAFTLATLACAVLVLSAYRFRIAAGLALGVLGAAIAVFAAGAWAGIAAALPVGWALGSACFRLAPWYRRTGLATGSRAAMFLFGTGIAALSPEVLAQVAAPPLYRILVPVDNQRQPQGSEYFIPLELLTRIEADERAAAWPAGSPVLWTAADYRLDVGDPSNPRLVVACELLSLGADATFTWPASDSRWEVADVRLDGRRLQAPGDAPGKVFLAESGRRRAEFVLRPMRGEQTAGELEFTLPTQPAAQLLRSANGNAAQASLRLQQPLPEPGREGTGALSLQEVSRLAWSIDRGTTANAPQRYELYWLKIRPDYVTIEAQLPTSAASASFLTSDRPLQLVSSTGVVGSSGTDPNGRQVIALPAADAVGVIRAMLLSSSSGVGRVTWPNLRASARSSGPRWLAISLDPELTWTLPPPDLTRAIEPADFLQAWGSSTARPVAVVQLPEEPLEWSVETAPRPAITRGRVVSNCDIGLAHSRIVTTADLNTISGFVLSHSVDLPEGFELESVTASQDGNERLAAAVRDGRRLTLFFTAPLAGPYRIVVEGRQRAAASGDYEFGRLEPLGVELAPFELRLFRRLSTSAELIGVRDAVRQELPDPNGESQARSALAALTATGVQFQARVSVAPNRPSASIAQLVRRVAGSQVFELDVAVHVDTGRADLLRFRLPPGWPRPRVSAPGAAVEWLDGAATETLLLRFRTPLAGDFRFQIEEWPAPAAGDARLPYLASLDDERWQRYTAIAPQQAATIGRAEQGFQLAALPESLASLVPSEATTWRVDSLDAKLVDEKPIAAVAPQIALADYAVHRNAAGTALVAGACDVKPAGISAAFLQLNADDELLALEIDGRPAFMRATGPGGWAIDLESSTLPQRIEFLFVRRPDRKTGRIELANPQWLIEENRPLTVKQTLWTTCDETRSARPNDTAVAEDFDERRLDNVSQLMADTLATSSGREAGGWLQAWLPRWTDAARWRGAELVRLGEPGAVDQASLVRRTAARQQQELLSTSASRGWLTPPAMPTQPSPVRTFWAGQSLPMRLTVDANEIPLEHAPPRWPRELLRSTLLAMALLACGALAWSSRRVTEPFVPALLAAAGLLWWAVGAVPGLGLVVVAWAAWQALPRDWRLPVAHR